MQLLILVSIAWLCAPFATLAGSDDRAAAPDALAECDEAADTVRINHL